MSKKYLQLLERQEWKDKSLEIKKRDGFQCQICLNKNVALQVHHKYYEKDKNPWEYPNDTLITLCEFCHEKVHSILRNKRSGFYIIPQLWGISIIDFLILEDRLITMKRQQGNINSALELITSQIITREEM